MHLLSSPLAAVLVLFSCSAVAFGDEAADALIKKGDVHYARLQPGEALKYYLPAEKLDPDNSSLLVRIARQYRHLHSEATQKAEKEKCAEIAVAYANRAAALTPNDSEAQLAVAVSYGKLLPFEDTKEKLACSKAIKIAAERAIKLDPQGDVAWQVLGRYYYGYAEVSPVKRALGNLRYGQIPEAKFEDAARCFEKAIALNPNRLMHYIELGRTYAKMNRTGEARKLIAKGISMPNTEKDDPETKQMGREILKTL